MLSILVPIIEIFSWGLIFYCILSFVRTPNSIKLYTTLGKVYRPLLDPISNLLAPLQKGAMGLDFSPLVLLLLLDFVKRSLSGF